MEPTFTLSLGSRRCEHVDAIAQAIQLRRAMTAIFERRTFSKESHITFDPAGEILLEIDGDLHSMALGDKGRWTTTQALSDKGANAIPDLPSARG